MIKKALISFAVVIVAFIAVIFIIFSEITHPPATNSGPVTTSTPTTGEGILEGQVFLGPVCPVEQNPPLSGCAPRPYATTVFVFDMNNTTTPYETLATDASGTFAITLPEGTYLVRAKSGSANSSALPRCGSTEVTITGGGTATTTLSCDTGIR